MSATPFLAIWTNLACAGGVQLAQTDYASCVYGAATDGTQTATIVIPRTEDAVLAVLGLCTVCRITDAHGTVTEYFIATLQDDKTSPLATITCQPVAMRLNKVLVRGLNRGRPSTVIADTLSAEEWIDLFVIPSLAAAGQSWWTAGTITVTVAPTFTLSFTDETVMWLLQQLIQNDPACILPERVGETGYLLHVKPPSASATPRAWVGENVTALTREISDTLLATVVTPAGATTSGNDEPERPWWVPFRAASIAGSVVTLDDPSGNGTAPLGDDAQWNVSGADYDYRWRLGTQPVPVLSDSSNPLTGYPLYRALYLQSTRRLWRAFGATGTYEGIRSYDLDTATAGALYASSVTSARDLYYYSSSDRLYVADGNGSRVTPYTSVSTSPTVGTPITVGSGPRRLLWSSGLAKLLVFHSGSNTVSQIDPTSNTVTASLTSMATPAHYAYVSDTVIYVFSNGTAACYQYNPTANTLTATLSLTGIAAYGAAVYVAASQEAWGFENTVSSRTKIDIIDTTTNTLKVQIETTANHGAVLDALVVNGNVYGVTADGYFVCYDGTSHALVFQRQHAAWTGSVALRSVSYLSDLDCFAIGADSGTLYFLDAQTGGATIARAITAASAATPSVTLATSHWPVTQYDEVAFMRVDGNPLTAIPDVLGIATYGVIERQVQSSFLYGGSNRVLNGDLTWFDSSRKAARFLNLAMPDSTTEAKWDGYDTPLRLFGCTLSSTGSTLGTAGVSINVTAAGANRVFQPGDILTNGSTIMFMVLAHATANGSGAVTLWALNLTGSLSYSSGTALTTYRPDPATLGTLGGSSMLALVCPLANTFKSTLSADLMLPYLPGEMTNLYWGIEAMLWGHTVQPSGLTLVVAGLDNRQTVLSVVPNPDPTLYDYTSLPAPMSFTGSVPLATAGCGGHLRLSFTQAYNGATLYIQRLWVRVGNADTGAPDDGAWALWQLGQDAVALRSVPPVTYTVAVEEDDPASPFVVGATVDLRDAAWGISASPQIVAIERPLPRNADETVQPVLTLESRAPSFVRLMMETTSNQ